MLGRTFFRIMIDNLFVNNVLSKTISAIIKFCYEQIGYNNRKSLKYFKNVPLKEFEVKNTYEKRFLFDSKKTTGVKLK